MPLARAIAIVYTLLIFYGCLNPFNFDLNFGLDPLPGGMALYRSTSPLLI